MEERIISAVGRGAASGVVCSADVIKKSLKLFAFTPESQRTQRKANLFVGRRSREFCGGDADNKNLPALLERFFAEGQRMVKRPPHHSSVTHFCGGFLKLNCFAFAYDQPEGKNKY